MNDIISKSLVEAGKKAAELAFQRMMTSSEPLVLAVEDTRQGEVIGFGKVFVSNDYWHPKMEKCTNNQKLHIRRDWSKLQAQSEICDFLRKVSILPQYLETENGVVCLTNERTRLRELHGLLETSAKIDTLIVKHSNICVLSV